MEIQVAALAVMGQYLVVIQVAALAVMGQYPRVGSQGTALAQAVIDQHPYI